MNLDKVCNNTFIFNFLIFFFEYIYILFEICVRNILCSNILKTHNLGVTCFTY